MQKQVLFGARRSWTYGARQMLGELVRQLMQHRSPLPPQAVQLVEFCKQRVSGAVQVVLGAVPQQTWPRPPQVPAPQLPLTQVVAPQVAPLAAQVPATQQPPAPQRLPSQQASPAPPHDWQVLLGMPEFGMHWVLGAVHTDGAPGVNEVRQQPAPAPPQPQAPLSPQVP